MIFKCQNLYKIYKTNNGSVPALDDVNFSVKEHEFVCIVGPSGCGKTTLLKIIAGLVGPTSGRVEFNPEENDKHMRSALVFQDHGLFPWMDVLSNVTFGLEMMGISRKERRDRAMEFIEKIDLSSFAERYPHELSIGMRQRVGIARAFVTGPKILLMDEPFGSLDAQTKLILQEELLRIWREQQKLVIHVTHDIDEAVLLSDRILVMTGRPGSIKEEINIPLKRPRDLSNRNRPDVLEIKEHIWRLLKDEVRKNLSINQ
ncbi:MAG: ABC transporter ATP-binding protein [Deltaproteobacteria bacterium]|nr:ABC transporter ATP-binding protein [Deltaproteobacteria bacterium]